MSATVLLTASAQAELRALIGIAHLAWCQTRDAQRARRQLSHAAQGGRAGDAAEPRSKRSRRLERGFQSPRLVVVSLRCDECLIKAPQLVRCSVLGG